MVMPMPGVQWRWKEVGTIRRDLRIEQGLMYIGREIWITAFRERES